MDEGKIIQNHTAETDERKSADALVDGTAFTVGPNSSVTLDSFIYNPVTAEGSLTVTSKGLIDWWVERLPKESCHHQN